MEVGEKQRTWLVRLQVHGWIEINVAAQDEEAAIEVAMDACTRDNIADWTPDDTDAEAEETKTEEEWRKSDPELFP